MLRIFGSLVSFLTILPGNNAGLEDVAKHMYLFPLVGIALGLLVGGAGLGMSMFLDPLLVGLLLAGLIVVLTGMHHTDGLADFADGLMAGGDKGQKLSAMKDVSTGSAGTAAVVLCMIGLVVLFSKSTGYELFLAVLVSEVMAKFSMVLLAGMSRSASQGSGTPFVKFMRDRKRLALSGMIALLPVFLLAGMAGLAAFGTAVSCVAILCVVSGRSFGGVTGDVLGAANEITRLAVLAVLVSL